jgi:small subunit ribosomal protein S6
MRQYELTLITAPDFQNQFTALWNKVENSITKDNGKVVDAKMLGKKKLAYPIKKSGRGCMYTINFVSLPTVIREIEHLLNLEERVLRYQTNVLKDNVDLDRLKIEYTGTIFVNDKEVKETTDAQQF